LNVVIFLALIPLTLIFSSFFTRYLISYFAISVYPTLDALVLGAIFLPISVFVAIATMIAVFFLQRRYKWVGIKKYRILFITYIAILLLTFAALLLIMRI